ncbi:MAG TPA: response regulator transcription factor [Steroidobacteraceae bacterium]|nr:response regulator transcription factor [Steroidobacteraceae bacterium]
MHVLLIEDHRDIAENVTEYLEGRGDTVDYAADGVTGLHLAVTHRYDVIVLDVMLPGLDGLALCRKLRQEGLVGTPVLMLTARDLLTDKVAGFEAGADDYLVKPFSLVELAARLGALVRRASRPTGARALAVSDLRFDLDTLQAERQGQPVKLNPTTRRLLACLMQNSHRVVSRAELERELWGDDPPEGDVLRAHMHALRAAIDRGFERKLLHTIHGAGYRLSDDPNASPD